MGVAGNFTIGSLARRNARMNSQRIGLVLGEKRISYEDFNFRVNRLAHAFMARGVSKGDRVAVMLPNIPQILEVYFACAKIGAIVLPVNLRLTPAEVTYILNDAGVLAVAVLDMFLGLLERDALESVKSVIVVGQAQEKDTEYESLLEGEDEAEPEGAEDVLSDDGFLLLYTSGTTGKPKGCVLSHRAMLANNFNLTARIRLSEDDRYLNVLPLFHMAGLGLALAVFHIGGRNVLMPMPDIAQMAVLLEEENVTFSALVPPLASWLIAHQKEAGHDLSALRFMAGMGGVESPETLRGLREILDCGFRGVYGQTECGNVASVTDETDELSRPGTCGRPLACFEWRLVDENGRDLPSGEVGELWLKGPSVMTEYWKRPEATEETLAGGWLRTGDLLWEDSDGYWYMSDRKKDLIKTGGLNVYPKEVELAIQDNPAVDQVSVVGVQDAEWGESVKACIVLKKDMSLTRGEVVDWVKDRLAGYKRPRYIEFIEAIPTNQIGKILKAELRSRPVNDDQRAR